MARIPDRLVQEILDKTDIVSVIGDHVRLTKKGSRWIGLCPFHAEKTPSFSVDADKGLFYCFGCHKGGSAVQFLMDLEKLSFPEAMEVLAAKAGIPLEHEEAPTESEMERRSLFELYERLCGTFHWFLTRHPSGREARERLRQRGLPDDIVEEFRLGYSPENRQWMHQFLLSKGYSAAFLAQSGLFGGQSRDYPIFVDRLMFPIADSKGRVIAFGGRLLHGDGPKYINSPDTLLFHKHDSLFALDKALPFIKKEGYALICEGYMDALSFHSAGVRAAVAPLGTAFTGSQARLLKRWADRVYLCFDADEAGLRAAERACAVASQAGLEVLVATLPGGKDASEILEKEGIGTLQKTRDLAINGGDFLVRRVQDIFETGTVEGKAKAAAYLFPYADALDSEVKRYDFLEYAARKLGANPNSLRRDYEAAKRGGPYRHDFSSAGDARRYEGVQSAARTIDLLLMAAVVLNAERFESLRNAIAADDLDDFRARDLYIALEECFRTEDMRVESVLARVEDESTVRFVREASVSGELSINTDKLISDGVAAIKRRSIERKRERLLAKIADAETGGGGGLMDLLAEKKRLDAEWEAIKGERE
jgi:DNA primase